MVAVGVEFVELAAAAGHLLAGARAHLLDADAIAQALCRRHLLLVLREADAELLFPGEAFSAYAGRLLSAGKHAVVLKRGEAGCIGAAPGAEPVALPAHEVAVVDPTGAGDCFCATFVALFAGGRSLGDALAYANAAGALAVGRTGPMEGNSSLGEIQAFLEAGS
jgi:sugar/nucleoside kinase (ribokinase family)